MKPPLQINAMRPLKQILGAVVIFSASLLSATLAGGQAQPVPLAQGPAAAAVAQIPASEMSEVAFKNVQVLRGIPVDEFLATMGFMSASTGLNCTVTAAMTTLSKAMRPTPSTSNRLLAR
jgi:hypothetical protein